MNSLASYGQGTFGDVMLRVGLIAYLMLGTLAGPAWCCCTFDRLTLPSAAAGESQNSSPVRTCCQHHAKPEKNKSSYPSKDQDPNAPGDRCPCKDQRPNQAPAVSGHNEPLTQLRASTESFDRDLLLPVFGILIGDGAYISCVRCNPACTFHLSGPELLCALQVFRC